jgi:glycine cleavage system H protein
MVPEDLRYTKEHEWVRVDGDEATVGITQYAADQLGDIVFVELPAVGRALEQFATFGVVESVKAVSDLIAPISGEIVEVQQRLEEHPEWLNEEPYGRGWIVVIEPEDLEAVESLLSAEQYRKSVEERSAE